MLMLVILRMATRLERKRPRANAVMKWDISTQWRSTRSKFKQVQKTPVAEGCKFP